MIPFFVCFIAECWWEWEKSRLRASSVAVSPPTVIITTNASCTKPRGNGSPTSSTSTNWCWSTTLSSMWAWQVSRGLVGVASEGGVGSVWVSRLIWGPDAKSSLSYQGALCPRAPHLCPRVAPTSASLPRRPPRCSRPLRTPDRHRHVLPPPRPSSRLWWPDALAEAQSVTAVMAHLSWRSLWERTRGVDHPALQNWAHFEGPLWPACPMTQAFSVSIPGPGVPRSP